MRRSRAHQLAEQFRVKRQRAEGEEQAVGPQGVALLEGAGSSMRLVAKEEGTQLLMLGGEPLDEPIAAQGPFVMNTQDELMQANQDYHSGVLGR